MSIPAIPDDFFDKAVADATMLLGVLDQNDHPIESDPRVKLCVEMAYAQITKACRRYFHYGHWTEEYPEEHLPFFLRTPPVDLSLPMWVDINYERGVKDTDWCLRYGKLFLTGEPTDTPPSTYKYVVADYYGGYKLCSENEFLLRGLVLQGAANFNRKDILGFSQVTGEKGVARTASNSGGILDSVVDIIQPLVYYGSGSDI